MQPTNKSAWHEFCAYFQALELTRLRRAYIEAHMSERGKTYREIAARHRMSAWYLAAAVIGKQPMARKHVAALEADLDIKLTAWLTPEETTKINKHLA